MVKVSVIIPVRETEGHLRECLDSIVTQTLSDIEIIIIGDLPSKKDIEIIEHYVNNDRRCFFIDNIYENGSGNARNLGIKRAVGKYIAFVDGDDFYPDPFVLENLFTLAESNQVNVCGGRLLVYDSITRKYEESKSGLSEKFVGIVAYSNYQMDGGFYRFIYDREFLLNNNIFFPNYLRFQDAVFFVKAMNASKYFYSTDLVTYIYRKGHKKVEWDKRKTIDHVDAVFDIAFISRRRGLARLHYLMAKNILDTCHFKLKQIPTSFLLYFYIIYRSATIFDWRVIGRENKTNKVRITLWKIIYFLFKNLHF